MSDSRNSHGGGIGLTGVVFVVFLVLKLTGHIDWSWWWVTAPLWGPAGILFALAGILYLIYLGQETVEAIKRKRRLQRALREED